MVRCRHPWNGHPWNVSLAAVSMAAFFLGMPALAWADDTPPAPPDPKPWLWPCQLIVMGELRAVVERAWEHSPTLRDQCRKLAAAGARMVVEPVASRETFRANTRIARTQDGVTLAHARVHPAGNAVELIAHEIEHVLEFADGVKFLMEAGGGRSGVKLSAGTYETRRAIDAGRRVAKEVRDNGRGRGAEKPALSELAQNSTLNPNCH